MKRFGVRVRADRALLWSHLFFFPRAITSPGWNIMEPVKYRSKADRAGILLRLCSKHSSFFGKLSRAGRWALGEISGVCSRENRRRDSPPPAPRGERLLKPPAQPASLSEALTQRPVFVRRVPAPGPPWLPPPEWGPSQGASPREPGPPSLPGPQALLRGGCLTSRCQMDTVLRATPRSLSKAASHVVHRRQHSHRRAWP